MLRAIGLGIGILAAGQAVGIAFLCTKSNVGVTVSAWVIWAATVAAAFVTARAAPRWKIAQGLFMAVPASVLGVLFNMGSEWLGFGTDFPGVQGSLIVFKFSLGWNALLSALGAGEGSYPAAKQKIWSMLIKRKRGSTAVGE
ncbi:hypothetical protein AnaeK_3624 [Anaeromyxobacter sp. K]|uniref:hypothetical protein n=1 Tax=Anaeromyxobacter sp. (strain K) TaxID=447217 RepID=UPI00015F93AB|nr:hypothetical protein [Anaeromyxobacter sp. K]ACG74837.1 hypothetical protein AnaeK_3624 [Anaeromyxobacter sp. K]